MMFESPIILGAFSQHDITKTPLDQAFSNVGKNTGNMLFSESLLRNVRGATQGHLGLSSIELARNDCIILAAANWLNDSVDMGPVYERLSAANKPIIIVGLGAQSTLDCEIPKLKTGTLKLIKLSSETSNAISVRGSFSAEVLNHYGIRNVDITGCPSALLLGETQPKIRSLPADYQDNMAVGGTRHGFSGADLMQLHIYRQAVNSGSDIILQSELSDMYFCLRRLNNIDINNRSKAVASIVYNKDPDYIERYLGRKAKVFFELDGWIDYMRTKSFYLGSRLHGAVAALLAGTPATLIAHDSRTKEAAVSLNIPYVTGSIIDLQKDLDFGNLYNRQQLTQFETGYRQYRSSFIRFFEGNGLSVI